MLQNLLCCKIHKYSFINPVFYSSLIHSPPGNILMVSHFLNSFRFVGFYLLRPPLGFHVNPNLIKCECFPKKSTVLRVAPWYLTKYSFGTIFQKLLSYLLTVSLLAFGILKTSPTTGIFNIFNYFSIFNKLFELL